MRGLALTLAAAGVLAWWLSALVSSGAENASLASDSAAPEVKNRPRYSTGGYRWDPSEDVTDIALASWRFTGGVPKDWSLLPGVEFMPGRGGARVTTTEGRSLYQLVSEPLSLPIGEYTVFLSARVADGGLQLGVLERENHWLANAFYRNGRDGQARLMTASFRVEHNSPLRIVLANWAQQDSSSTWVLRNAFIRPGTERVTNHQPSVEDNAP